MIFKQDVKSNSLVNSFDDINSSSGSSIEYQKVLLVMISSIKDLMVCPISLQIFDNPVITPSGCTINASIMKELISKDKNDPFDKTKKCTDLVVNRFVSDVKEIIQIAKHKNAQIAQEGGDNKSESIQEAPEAIEESKYHHSYQNNDAQENQDPELDHKENVRIGNSDSSVHASEDPSRREFSTQANLASAEIGDINMNPSLLFESIFRTKFMDVFSHDSILKMSTSQTFKVLKVVLENPQILIDIHKNKKMMSL